MESLQHVRNITSVTLENVNVPLPLLMIVVLYLSEQWSIILTSILILNLIIVAKILQNSTYYYHRVGRLYK